MATHDYAIYIDSCSDLPWSYCQEADLKVLQFTYTDRKDPEGGLSGIDDMFSTITARDFYNAMRKGAEPMTAQLTQAQFEGMFSEIVDSGKPGVFLCFTSGLSSTFDSASLALDRFVAEHGAASAEELGIYLVDTKQACIPEGLLCMEAAQQRDRGLTAPELAAWAEEARTRIHCMFMVEDLDTLHRGGRIPASVALVGTKLDVKPLLTIDAEGKLAVIGVARGRKKGVRRLAEAYVRGCSEEGRAKPVFVGGADCDADLKRLCNLVRKENETALIYEMNIGPVIGSHVGPGMIAITWWGESRSK